MQSELVTLNLSKNSIKVLENLRQLTKLQTMTVGHNYIAHAASCEELRHLPSITTLDLQENKIEDVELLDILAAMPALAVLYLQGNPLVKKVKFYRKQVIGRLPGLRYLDDRPVFEDERARCDVWWRVYQEAGAEAAAAAERVEIERQAREKKETEERNFQSFAEFVRRAAEVRAAESGEELEEEDAPLPEGPIPGDDWEEGGAGEHGAQPKQSRAGPTLARSTDAEGVNVFSGEDITRVAPESASARALREERWARIVESSEAYRAKEPAVAQEAAAQVEAARTAKAAAAAAALEEEKKEERGCGQPEEEVEVQGQDQQREQEEEEEEEASEPIDPELAARLAAAKKSAAKRLYFHGHQARAAGGGGGGEGDGEGPEQGGREPGVLHRLITEVVQEGEEGNAPSESLAAATALPLPGSPASSSASGGAGEAWEGAGAGQGTAVDELD